MTYSLRKYHKGEEVRAFELRELISEEDKERFKKRLETAGEWVDHYLHLALDKDGELIGDVQLRHCDRLMPTGVAHIGIDIGREYRNQGAATKALELAWTWAQKNNFHRLEGSTELTNLAMKKAFENAGWHFEGTLKNLFFKDGVGYDYLSFAKTI